MGKCSFCGAFASGFWQGVGVKVACCPHCATEVLPALAADALVGDHPLPNVADRLHKRQEQAALVFWQQATVAINRARSACLDATSGG
ncbi:MAG TPA: hypothetical protein VEL76_17915 [Gemmataceae bacterium]|nr:hypothetical protein [Gemmataceae bacterium]